MTPPSRLWALTGLLLIPSGLSAQTCLAAPHAPRAWIGTQVARTSPEQNLIGADVGVRAGGWVTIRAEGDFVQFDQPTPDRKRAQAGVVIGKDASSLPICLSASSGVTRMGDLTILSIPIGIVAGWTARLGSSQSSLTTSLEPRVAYRRATVLGFHDVSMPFTVAGESGVSRGRVYGGIHVEWEPSDSHGWAVGLRAVFGL